MDFIVNYLIIGMFAASICASVNYIRYHPFAEIDVGKWIVGVFLWPMIVVATIISIILKGWRVYG